jgi:hypothetical protein
MFSGTKTITHDLTTALYLFNLLWRKRAHWGLASPWTLQDFFDSIRPEMAKGRVHRYAGSIGHGGRGVPAIDASGNHTCPEQVRLRPRAASRVTRVP